MLRRRTRRLSDLPRPRRLSQGTRGGVGGGWPSRTSDKAREAAQRAVDLDPNDGQSRWALAQAQRTAGDLEAALTTAEEALALHPGDGLCRWERAHILGRMGRSEEAAESLASVEGLAERVAGLTRGLLLFRLGRWVEAEAAVRHGLRLGPKKLVESQDLLMRVLRAAGDREGESAVAESLFAFDRMESEQGNGRERVLAHQRSGGTAARLWAPDRAASWYASSYPEWPAVFQAAFECGQANERWRLSADAEVVLAHLDRAHELAPAFAEAWLSRGRILRECGRVEDAKVALAKAKRHGRGLFDPAIELAGLHFRRGEWEQALKLYLEVREAIGWGDESIARTEKARAVNERFEEIVAGTLLPEDGKEARLFAEVAMAHDRYALATRLLEAHLQAIPEEPRWEWIHKQREGLFLATECGFRAASGEGKVDGGDSLDEEERDRLRERAMVLTWELLAVLEEGVGFVEKWGDTLDDLDYPRRLLVHPAYEAARADQEFTARLQALWNKHR